jgi:hypothetical protein
MTVSLVIMSITAFLATKSQISEPLATSQKDAFHQQVITKIK